MFGFNKSSIKTTEKNLLFHEDLSSKDVSEAIVGRKGDSLFKLRDMDIPLPGFFVISPAVYKKFLLGAFSNKLANLMEKVKSPDVVELEKLILKADFDQDFMEELHQAYSRLSGFSDAWVATRSSVVYPQRSDVSFSGVFKTELNIKGFDHLVESIKHIYLSVFKKRVIMYAKGKNIDVSEIQMAVVIQKMVQPEVSGVAYTLDPVTNDNKRMSIEAVFGLGDVITDGQITPDQYVLDKKNLDVVEKHIAPQEWMKIRKPWKLKPGSIEELQKIQISKTWSHQQKLEDSNIQSVAKVALIVEEQAKMPQSVEWIWESGNVWVLQSKDVLIGKKDFDTSAKLSGTKLSHQDDEQKTEESVFDVAIDIVKEETLKDIAISGAALAKMNNDNLLINKEVTTETIDKSTASLGVEVRQEDDLLVNNKEAKKEVKKLSKISERLHKITAKKDKKQEEAKKQIEIEQLAKLGELGLVHDLKDRKLEFLLTGIGASNGEIAGEIKILTAPVADGLIVTKETILLVKNFTQEMEGYILQSGGVLMDEGGLTSDISILCRENMIPAVVGTGLASALLKEKDIVKIDGNVGSVYRVGKEPKVEDSAQVVSSAIERKEKEADSVASAAKRARELAMKEAALSSSKAIQEPAKNTKEKIETEEKIITAMKVMLLPEDSSSVERYSSIVNHLDGVCYIDLDMLMLSNKRHPLAYVEDKKFREYSKEFEKFLDDYTDAIGGSEVIVSIGSAPVEMFRALVKGSSMENKDTPGSQYGVQKYLENKELLTRALSIVKKVRNVYKSRNLSLAVHSPMNGEIMRKMKREISASGLKRTGTFNIYAVIDNPAEVILAEDILDAGLDGMILNTPRLARQMQALPMYGDNVKYDIGVSSVLKILENAVSQVRGSKYKVIVIAEDNKTLIKRCVEWGVYGIAVSPDSFVKTKKLVSNEEAKMIMNIGVVTG